MSLAYGRATVAEHFAIHRQPRIVFKEPANLLDAEAMRQLAAHCRAHGRRLAFLVTTVARAAWSLALSGSAVGLSAVQVSGDPNGVLEHGGRERARMIGWARAVAGGP